MKNECLLNLLGLGSCSRSNWNIWKTVILISTTHCSHFEVFYVFNPLTPLDLLPILFNIFVSETTTSNADLIKRLHKEVKERIEKQIFKVASRNNKGRKEIIFQPGDLVWIHFRKERFQSQRKTKLHPRGDNPYQVLEKINNTAYKIGLLGEFSVHSTFNVADFNPFDLGNDFSNSRTNLFEKCEDDKDLGVPNVSTGPITR